MFYSIAVIQNEKELFRYSCANMKPFFKSSKYFQFYKTTFFNENNIADLFQCFSNFDAVFFLTNSLNNEKIVETLLDNKDKIAELIHEGKGMYIGYSSKVLSYEFLPEEYRVSGQARNLNSEGDSHRDGELHFDKENIFFNFPNYVDFNEYVQKSNEHSTLKGLYFNYYNSVNLKYKAIIEDSIFSSRFLLLVPETGQKHKVVLSNLPIDWQGHTGLMENIVKYCTEGNPEIGVITDSCSRQTFAKEYLLRQLELNKIAYCVVDRSEFDKIGINKMPFSIIIFDTQIGERKIEDYCKRHQDEISEKNIRIFHFSKNISSNKPLYKLDIYSGYQDFDDLEKKVLIYILSKVPSEKTKYYFDSNLLATKEAITILKQSDSVDVHLLARIIDAGKKHLRTDGSYDEMFVSSCNFLQLWNICSVETQNDASYAKLKRYVEGVLIEESNSNDPHEKAVAICTIDLDFSQDILRRAVTEIENYINCTNDDELSEYLVVDLLEALSKNYDIADKSLILKLIYKINRMFADFTAQPNVSLVASFSSSIIDLFNSECFKNDSNIDAINKILFTSITYLYKQFNTEKGNWNNDIYSTCVVFKTLKKFNQLCTYPIDEILLLLANIKNKNIEVNLNELYKIANQHTTELSNVIDEKRMIKEELEKLANEHNGLLAEVELKNNELGIIKRELERIKKKLKFKTATKVLYNISVIVALLFIAHMVYLGFANFSLFQQFYKSMDKIWIYFGGLFTTVATIVTILTYFKDKKD